MLSIDSIYNKFEKYINCGIDCNELEDLRNDIIKKIEVLEQQQKQPPKECIEWLEEKIDRYTYYKTIYPNKVDMWDVEIMKKLLKYFKEIK